MLVKLTHDASITASDCDTELINKSINICTCGRKLMFC